MGNSVPFQIPLALPQPPNAGQYRRRLHRAKGEAELRLIAEEIIRDFEAEVERLQARRTVVETHLEDAGKALTMALRVCHS